MPLYASAYAATTSGVGDIYATTPLQVRGSGDSGTEDPGHGAYLRTRERLMAAGIAQRHDDEARPDYLALRLQWSGAARGLMEHFGYQHRPDA